MLVSFVMSVTVASVSAASTEKTVKQWGDEKK